MATGAPENCEEAELIRKICQGQTEFFYPLIQPYEHKVFSIALSVLNNAADAEEVAQEAFLKALKGLRDFRGDAKFSTWLIQIALNEARSRLRRAPSLQPLDECDRSEDGDYLPRDLADWREIPCEALARKELREKIEQAIQALQPIYRDVLVLRDIQQLSIAETSQLLGISKDLVKTRLLRARFQMREALAPGYDGSWTSESKRHKRIRPW
jgi:RNA polymerase sigma-70 factor, ECF subfamily